MGAANCIRTKFLCLLLTATYANSSAGADDGDEFFEKRVRPILVKHCYQCHSGEAKELKGGLLLDTRDAIRKGGDSGPAVVPGKPNDSHLIAAIRHESIEMPPKEKLPDEVIADFVKWVQIGAPDPRDGRAAAGPAIEIEAARRSWAYQTPKLPQRPEVADTNWPLGDIDRLVLATLEANGLHPAASADRRTLIRRAAYDLLGLPPTPEEIAAFLADTDAGAFERVVDRMLKSPDFGIRWARHWLDNVRYAQDDPTCNANSNGTFSIGPYRDWVVKSFNEDLPYDQFVRLQVAGDLIPLDDPELINTDGFTATGIWGLAHLVEGNDKEKVVADFVDEQLDVLGRTFLGLTVSCSRCHDHKFDPITQSDYYGLAGIFYSSHIFTFKGKSARERDRVQMRAFTTKASQREFELDEQQLAKLESEIAAIEKKHENALELMDVRRDLKAQMMLEPKTDNERARIEKRIKELRRKESELVADQKKKGWDENPAELWQHAKLAAERDEFKKKIGRFPLRMVMREGPVPGTRHKEPGDMPVFIRGGKQRGERPYLTLMLHATAVHPRLTFDRPEVILPAVPLGHTARASFYVINEGYDNLQIQHRLPVDPARAPRLGFGVPFAGDQHHATTRFAASSDGRLLYSCGYWDHSLKATQLALITGIHRLTGADQQGPALQDLAALLAIQLSALTHALRPLVRDGIVELRQDARDRLAQLPRLAMQQFNHTRLADKAERQLNAMEKPERAYEELQNSMKKWRR